jgi:hypothetical protein
MRVVRRRVVISVGAGPASRPPQGILARALGFVAGALVLAGAFVLSMVLFALLLGAGVVAGAYLWWKTRAIRRQRLDAAEAARRADPERTGPSRPTTIEGEFTREQRAAAPFER